MIYCVEDDAGIRELVVYTLQNTGLEARGFSDGGALFEALRTDKPQLILLDIMLPGEDGITILRRLRAAQETANIPVILLTAKNTEYDKVIGLDSGADDYIAKPFGVLELIARVNAALRRAHKSSVIRAGQVVMNTENMSVTYHGKELDLSNKEFQLLKYFMQNEGRVLSREVILSDVWGYDGGETRTLDNHIARLRKAGLNFETVFGVGYKFIAD